MTEDRSFDMTEYKTCTKCGQSLPLQNFHKDKYKLSGLTPQCKKCRNASTARHAALPENKAKQKERDQKRWRENREHESARWREWRLANLEHRQIYLEEFRKKNPDYYAGRMREYRKRKPHMRQKWAIENPEKQRENDAKRRARKLQAKTFLINKKEAKALYCSPCVYCGSRENIQMDHVVPLSRGGAHGVGNIVPACRKCNISKHNFFVMEWKRAKQKNS
jgi:5-methylcytosine-specific restriction endonuclease McrA